MKGTKFIRVGDVMKKDFDLVDGITTVAEALTGMHHPNTGVLIVNKRSTNDEYGIVMLADIAKKVLAKDRSPARVNVYEIMSKPVLGVSPQMNIRYCARLFDRFGLSLAPVIEAGNIVGVVGYNDMVIDGMLNEWLGNTRE
ncbi:CBS domain-containing protein [Nitrosomonas sp. ANs5]|uniref:CBS domain-containing protein n=1 Tax=Nitrosomonas sp. ANs5 TaxID=3423941 RepID=UPI003D3522B0